MVDLDDIGNAALFGSIPILIILIIWYLVFSVPEIDKCHDQTRLAIDTATAMRVYAAAGIADTGKKVIEARAGATQITVNTRESK